MNETTAILAKLQNAIRRELTPIEAEYFKTQIRNVKPAAYGKKNIREMSDTLVKIFLEDLRNPTSISKAFAEPALYDMHEVMKREIREEIEQRCAVNEKRVAHTNVHRILGYDSSYQIRKELFPATLVSEAYVVLDRRYHLRTDVSRSKFVWNFATQNAHADPASTVTTSAPVQNIVGLELFPFRLPRHPDAILSTNRISVFFEEFENQSFIASEERRRYQFVFNVTQSAGAYDPLVLSDLSGEVTEFNFFQPVRSELNTLTVSFGNPFRTLQLDKDILPAVISSSGIQTLLTFSEPHFMTVGDRVIISSFTTSSPGEDSVEIDQLNDADGWEVSALTSTTLTIDVDISGLTGTITGNPYNIYLESKRFVLHLKIKYIRPA